MYENIKYPPISSSYIQYLSLIIVTIDDITITNNNNNNNNNSSNNPKNNSNSPSNNSQNNTQDNQSPSSSSNSFNSYNLSNNLSECIICLEELKIGHIYCKLDCGHIFHYNCIIEWLNKQCTCPECRYEYPTDNKQYEIERKRRMKNRRLRLRKDELNKKTVKQLKDIFEIYNLDMKNCFEKSELINKLINSGYIDLQRRAPPIEISWNELKNKSVSELKKMMLAFGISSKTLIEKDELLEALRNSGRLTIINTDDDDEYNTLSSNNNNSSLYSYSSSTMLGDDSTYPTPFNTYQNNNNDSNTSTSQSSSQSTSQSNSRSQNNNYNNNNNNNNRNRRQSRNNGCIIA